jgi:hypothetical protein
VTVRAAIRYEHPEAAARDFALAHERIIAASSGRDGEEEA